MVSLIFFNIRKGYVDDGEGEKLTLLFQLWTSDYAPLPHSCLLRDSRAVGILIPVSSFALHFVGGEERSPIGVRLNAPGLSVSTPLTGVYMLLVMETGL